MATTTRAWYKTVDVAESVERLAKRWSGVEIIVSKADLAVVPTLLAIAEGRNHLVDEDAPQRPHAR